ncbi:MAG: DNA-3-methyladenine glycosylase, partial [Pyrinomonadaceae bacterium]|nr:DNA-3-methyladenine glycosylase [Pyrinomonadaceae bacterium]
ILIRAVEPLEGIGIMRNRRGKMPDNNLTSGPGKLCIALGINKSFSGENLSDKRVWIEDTERNQSAVISSGKRIGIDYAEEFTEKPWRFWLDENIYVSR